MAKANASELSELDDALEESLEGEISDDSLKKVINVAAPVVVGAIALPFVISATAISTTIVGGIAGAACAFSYLAGKKNSNGSS